MRQEDQRLAVDLFQQEKAAGQHLRHSLLDRLHRHFQQFHCRGLQLLQRQGTMSFGGCPQKYVVYPSPSPILRILGYSDALSNLIRRGEADAVDLLRQGVRVLPHRLDGQISVGLVDADCSPGADTVAVEEDHDLADLHSLLPGTGDPFPALWTDAIDGLQVGGVVFNYTQYLGTKVADQLLRQDGANTLHEAAGQVPFDTLARRWRDGFQDLRFELETMLLVPHPPTFCGQPLPGAYRRQ